MKENVTVTSLTYQALPRPQKPGCDSVTNQALIVIMKRSDVKTHTPTQLLARGELKKTAYTLKFKGSVLSKRDSTHATSEVHKANAFVFCDRRLRIA